MKWVCDYDQAAWEAEEEEPCPQCGRTAGVVTTRPDLSNLYIAGSKNGMSLGSLDAFVRQAMGWGEGGLPITVRLTQEQADTLATILNKRLN